jgi:hypothetical protein
MKLHRQGAVCATRSVCALTVDVAPVVVPRLALRLLVYAVDLREQQRLDR